MDWHWIAWIVSVSVALGCDAFSVSLGVAGPFRGQNFRIAFHFGLFQAFMPLIGYALGRTVVEWVRDWDHWIAFGLLAAIGGHMLWEAFAGDPEVRGATDRSRRWSLVALSTAVSIDALAVGVIFGIQETSPWWPCLLIGLVTGGMSLVGLYLGRRLRSRFGKAAEVFGGVILLLLAVKFLGDL